MIQSLIDLPDPIKRTIIKYLPQQSLINLACTNFEFYPLCLQQLYSRILIQYYPPLRGGDNRETDFQDSCHTVIYGFDKVLDTRVNMDMIHARLTVLIQSLSVNPELINYITQICVIGCEFDDEKKIVNDLQGLINKLSKVDKFYIESDKVRKSIHMGLKLKSVIVDEEIDYDEDIEEMLISECNKVQPMSEFTFSLKTLILPNNEEMYWTWMKRNVIQPGHSFPSLTKFKFVFNMSDFNLNIKLIHSINWHGIKQLELVFNYTNNDTIVDCFNLFSDIPLPKLTKLSIVQNELYPTHEENELFDLNVFDFVASCKHLTYLSIKHFPPRLGNLIDGFEGCYYRRLKLYTEILPKILNNLPNRIILIMPNFFQSMAGYEQYMNTVLWNGCKCSHCEIYLEKLDQFLMHHKYYNVEGRYRDMNASHLFSEIGYRMSSRLINLNTGLDYCSYPLMNYSWDFHQTKLKPFKCYDVQTIDLGEYEEDDEERENANGLCKFNQKLFMNIPKCVGHYLDSYISKVLNLNRGNAEEVDEKEESFKDGGDEVGTEWKIKKMIVNGVSYDIDKEINGTHFYQSLYD